MAKNIDTAKSFIAAANSIVQSLAEVNPRDEEFDNLLFKHERLCRTALQYMDLQERVAFFLGEMAEIENDNNEVVIPLNAKVSQIVEMDTDPAEEHPVEQPFPESTEEEKPDEHSLEPSFPRKQKKTKAAPAPEEDAPLTLDQVKKAFTEAARAGVKVSEIINDTGYTKLSDVPADLYGALMRALERKQNGEE